MNWVIAGVVGIALCVGLGSLVVPLVRADAEQRAINREGFRDALEAFFWVGLVGGVAIAVWWLFFD